MKLKSILALAAAVAAFSAPLALARDEGKLIIWGGGAPGKSVYTDVYVPHLVKILADNALSGYQWGGTSDGTLDNAVRVSQNPTHLAVGQLDLLRALARQPGTSADAFVPTPLPDGTGNYAITILAENIGPECLYLVTNQPGYETFGDFLGNTWQATVATGGELSGSYGTWQVLANLYPAMTEAIVNNVGGATDIIAAVEGGTATHGFFIMRPDPQSDTFKAIADAKLTIVPVVDAGLEGSYDFFDLKVANGWLFGEAKTVTTACTSVALITGSPDGTATQALSVRDQKRLKATIDRIAAVPPDALKPNISSWQDMFDSLKAVGADKLGEMMEASKTALENILEEAGA